MDLTTVFSRYNFFQQVRLMLRRLQGRSDNPGTTSLTEAISFVSPLSLDAPAGEVGQIIRTEEGLWQVEVLTHGMTGALGALPTAYTEWMLERYYRYGDKTAKAFVDIFNNRLHALRYLAWLKYHYYASYEVSRQCPISEALLGLAGVLQSAPSLQNESFAGLFMHPVRSALNLESWLENLFSVPARVRSFTGGWLRVPSEQCCHLGYARLTLGQAPMLGRVRRDRASGFTVELGPLPLSHAPQYLPGGKFYVSLSERIREYVGPGLSFSVELITKHDRYGVPGQGCVGVDLCLGQPGPGFHRVCLPVYREQE
ncbi:type VI secretion system baseplate subunit TssG [Enterobacter asburiae]